MSAAARVARFALNRLGYGPRPGSIDELLSRGTERWAQNQLHPGDDPVDARVANFPALNYTIGQWIQLFNNDRNTYNTAVRDHLSAHFVRAVHGKNQLVEVLTDFWFNHFNVNGGEQLVRYGLTRFELDAIRPHVLGKFRDLLGAVADVPNMTSVVAANARRRGIRYGNCMIASCLLRSAPRASGHRRSR